MNHNDRWKRKTRAFYNVADTPAAVTHELLHIKKREKREPVKSRKEEEVEVFAETVRILGAIATFFSSTNGTTGIDTKGIVDDLRNRVIPRERQMQMNWAK